MVFNLEVERTYVHKGVVTVEAETIEEARLLAFSKIDDMDACDLEYCETCGWIFSRTDGYGESSDDSIVCYDCGEKDDD